MIAFEQKKGEKLPARLRKAEKTERNQREMVANMGVSTQTLHKLFAGEVPKHYETIEKVNNYLDGKDL